eukprot:Opistho-2@50740
MQFGLNFTFGFTRLRQLCRVFCLLQSMIDLSAIVCSIDQQFCVECAVLLVVSRLSVCACLRACVLVSVFALCVGLSAVLTPFVSSPAVGVVLLQDSDSLPLFFLLSPFLFSLLSSSLSLFSHFSPISFSRRLMSSLSPVPCEQCVCVCFWATHMTHVNVCWAPVSSCVMCLLVRIQ